MTDTVADSASPEILRAQLVDRLRNRGWITDPVVAAAFARVPRHLFTPLGTSLSTAYADAIVATKRDPDGKTLSSVSAPWLQAYMIEQARLRPGACVLEIGSGGYNAALLAETVGPSGAVVTVDIDADVAANARAALSRVGYPQVQVVHGDGELGHAAGEPYAAVIVTVNASDIAPAWVRQLAPDGVLIVPLRMRGNTRCLTLQPDGDRLLASASLQCGFVTMQGVGHHPVRRIPLRGEDAVLVLDDSTTEVDGDALRAALDGPRLEVWSPVTLSEDASFESLHLFVASQPRPYGVLTVDREHTAGLLDPQDRFICPTMLTSHSLAYLTSRHDGQSWQLGAHGFGPDAAELAADLVEVIAGWDRHYRGGPGPLMRVRPAGSRAAAPAPLRMLVPRRHTVTALTWPLVSR